MKLMKATMIAGVALFLSNHASAESQTFLIKDLPDRGNVAINGTVTHLEGADSFVLADSTGTIKVVLGAAKTVVLEDGEKIMVIGTVDEDLFETHIAAFLVTKIDAATSEATEASNP